MLTKKPAYPVGIAVRGQGGAKTKGNRHFRSERQRRKAFEKEQDALIKAAWKRWGDVEMMPQAAKIQLHDKITKLSQQFGV